MSVEWMASKFSFVFMFIHLKSIIAIHCRNGKQLHLTSPEKQSCSDMADDLKCSKYWFNAFLSNVLEAFLIVKNLVLQIGGNLKNLKRILRGVSPTSFKGCLFYCRPAKKGQLKQQMSHEVLDGIVVKVMCSY